MKVGDWELTLQNIKRSTMQDFFFWVLENHKIGSEGTSKEYIRQFQQLYTTITSRFADRNDIAELYKVLIYPIYPFTPHRCFLLTSKSIMITSWPRGFPYGSPISMINRSSI